MNDIEILNADPVGQVFAVVGFDPTVEHTYNSMLWSVHTSRGSAVQYLEALLREQGNKIKKTQNGNYIVDPKLHIRIDSVDLHALQDTRPIEARMNDTHSRHF